MSVWEGGFSLGGSGKRFPGSLLSHCLGVTCHCLLYPLGLARPADAIGAGWAEPPWPQAPEATQVSYYPPESPPSSYL